MIITIIVNDKNIEASCNTDNKCITATLGSVREITYNGDEVIEDKSTGYTWGDAKCQEWSVLDPLLSWLLKGLHGIPKDAV